MRVLALDLGSKRIGVAVSDIGGTVASPLTVLQPLGSVATLFVAMQVTGRIRWTDKFSLKPEKEAAAELT